MKRTATSPDSVASPSLQPVTRQFSIAFILPESTYTAGLRSYFRTLNPLFHQEHGLACGQKD